MPAMPEAEHCLQEALAIARRQHARSFELRAAINLSRLWHQQGKLQAARTLLGDVYRGFREGWETLDLQEAQTLLEAWA
ncbi:MAG: hypothetical protein FJZ47_01755 [Candidatus Tectomicrobia bacterium]|uniref:MalT-like TPR region domain-containing protein n=1 Tax=Tectimicrobiota bacterium TaxID=2528274 RepID=A0A937VZD6_UNCTE|nr:hypothetical protein [Candidatus Tectomicrobia bacterium]